MFDEGRFASAQVVLQCGDTLLGSLQLWVGPRCNQRLAFKLRDALFLVLSAHSFQLTLVFFFLLLQPSLDGTLCIDQHLLMRCLSVDVFQNRATTCVIGWV